MSEEKKITQFAPVSKMAFVFCTCACILFFGPLIIFREAAQPYVNSVMRFITHGTDWMWLVVVLGCLIFLLWLAFGRYGKVKLGKIDEEPEFSTFTWIAMIFQGSTGGALVYWSMVEPMYYMMWPPYWVEPVSAQSAQYALSYAFMHWGVSAWTTFALPAVVFAYSYYVRRKPYLFPSYACRDVLGKRLMEGGGGKVLNAILAFGMVGGMATALGFVVPMMSNIFSSYVGIADSAFLKVIICLMFATIYIGSAYRGLHKGLAVLSNFNMYIAFALLGFVILVGPTGFSLSLTTDNLGVYFNEYFRMSLYTDPVAKSSFPQDWTVFYWAWWLSWAIYIGLYCARISKGRTIRSVILAMIAFGSLATFTFFTVFGGYIVDAMLNRGIELGLILSEQGGPAIVTWLMNDLPGTGIVIPCILFYLLIGSSTCTDSAAYTLANMQCTEVRVGMEPPKWSRVYCGLLILVCTIAVILVGGRNVVQMASVIPAIPLLPLMIVFCVTLKRWLKADFGAPDYLTTNKYKDDDEESYATTTTTTYVSALEKAAKAAFGRKKSDIDED